MTDYDLPPPAAGRYPFWTYRDALILGLLAIPLLFLSVGLVGGFIWALGWKPPAKAVPLLAAQFLFYSLWLACLCAWIKGHYHRPFWRSLAWLKPPKGWWHSFAWGVLTALAVIALIAVVKPPPVETAFTDLLRDPASVVWVALFAVTLGPLWEELAFRGFLLPLLARSLTAVPAVVLTAVVFAGLHSPQYAWSWKHLALVAVAGSAFGWMRQWSGSTAAATVMHAGYNLVFAFLGVLAARHQA
jgi:hypothetical protein